MDKTGGKSARWMTSTGKNKLTKSDPRPAFNQLQLES
jgi:hypothetical protein